MRLNILLAAVLILTVSLLLVHRRDDSAAAALQTQLPGVCQQFDPDQSSQCGNNLCGFSTVSSNTGFSNGPGGQSLQLNTTTCKAGADTPENPCVDEFVDYYTRFTDPTCPTPTPTPTPTPPPTPTPTPYNWCWDPVLMEDCESHGGIWKGCRGCYSPIVLDVQGNGFNLTSAAGGVSFDIDGDGAAENLSWTAANSDDAWLFLDRNENGTVDNGLELFGNFAPQPPSNAPNGFLALAEYDKPGGGGNGDGVIDAGDAIYPDLRLWRDVNHNGVSEPHELHALSAFDVAVLDLDYKESKRTDAHGNRFKYRAKLKDGKGAKVGRWAWDVFLQKAP